MVFEKMENNNSSGESESESDFKAEVSYLLFYPHKVASRSGTPKECDQSVSVENSYRIGLLTYTELFRSMYSISVK
jgi:hypothetical protein